MPMASVSSSKLWHHSRATQHELACCFYLGELRGCHRSTMYAARGNEFQIRMTLGIPIDRGCTLVQSPRRPSCRCRPSLKMPSRTSNDWLLTIGRGSIHHSWFSFCPNVKLPLAFPNIFPGSFAIMARPMAFCNSFRHCKPGSLYKSDPVRPVSICRSLVRLKCLKSFDLLICTSLVVDVGEWTNKVGRISTWVFRCHRPNADLIATEDDDDRQLAVELRHSREIVAMIDKLARDRCRQRLEWELPGNASTAASWLRTGSD